MRSDILLILLGMALVSYAVRVLPIWALAKRKLPPALTTWLSFVPVTVLAALLAPGLVMQKNSFDPLHSLFFWAALPCFLVAVYTKSFFGTVATGMVVVALARYLDILQYLPF